MMLSLKQIDAQDTLLLKSILEVGQGIESVKANVHHRREKNGDDNISERNGVFYYSATDKFTALFDDGQFMIINGDYANMDIGVFHEKVRMRQGPIRSLSQVFLYACQGRCAELGEINNFSLDIKTSKMFHVVTMTTKKKIHIGFGLRQVVLKYGINDLHVKEISITDYRGITNTFTLSQQQYNVSFNPSVFDI